MQALTVESSKEASESDSYNTNDELNAQVGNEMAPSMDYYVFPMRKPNTEDATMHKYEEFIV